MTQLPSNTTLDHLKDQAKSLLKLARAGDSDTLKRFAPYFECSSDALPRLYQAQLVIARELGFDSWPKLKEVIEKRDKIASHVPTVEKREQSSGSYIGTKPAQVEYRKLPLMSGIGLAIRSIFDKKSRQYFKPSKKLPSICSFCEKSKQDIKKLIAGPGVTICDECVYLCIDIIDGKIIKEQTKGD